MRDMVAMPSDSYKVTPAQFLPFPGKCWTCGSNQRDCVDFNFNTEYDGVVLICVSCIKELAKVDELEFELRRNVEHITDQNNVLMLQLGQAELAKKELRDGVVAVLDTYDAAIANLASGYVPVLESHTEADPESEKLLF